MQQNSSYKKTSVSLRNDYTLACEAKTNGRSKFSENFRGWFSYAAGGHQNRSPVQRFTSVLNECA